MMAMKKNRCVMWIVIAVHVAVLVTAVFFVLRIRNTQDGIEARAENRIFITNVCELGTNPIA